MDLGWDLKRLLCLLLIVGSALVVSGCLRSPEEEITELRYQAPVKLTIKPGEDVPGTEIRYLGLKDERAEFQIEGKQALKSKGDSLDWDGNPVAGADVDLNLRVAWFDTESVQVVGTAKIVVDHPVPQAVNVPESTPMTYHAPVVYGMAPEALVPGTLYSYVGATEEGAQLGGGGGLSVSQERRFHSVAR